MSRYLIAVAAAVLTLGPTQALAHTGAGPVAGSVAGLGHPLGGLDHLLAMLAVGLSAALIGSRALWLMPLAFMSAMALAGMTAVAGWGLPYVELGIGLSVVVIGIMALSGASVPLVLGVAVVGAFGIFHGHAHGAEMPASVSGITYGAGFLAATGALHLAGIALGLGLSRVGPAFARAAGGVVAVLGTGLLVGAV